MSDNILPVSFKGKLFITVTNKGSRHSTEYNITNSQFRLIKKVIDNIAPTGEVTKVKSSKLTFIYKYLKNTLKIKQNLNKQNTHKFVYNSAYNIGIHDSETQMPNVIKLDFQA
ncbi:hypothetical protein J6P92_02480 [bacterium]|nr:hypothetical protein [bacterium]